MVYCQKNWNTFANTAIVNKNLCMSTYIQAYQYIITVQQAK